MASVIDPLLSNGSTCNDAALPAQRNGASALVFGIPELLESILMNIDTKTLLLSQRCGKQWQAVISGSTTLQKMLFMIQPTFDEAITYGLVTANSPIEMMNDETFLFKNPLLFDIAYEKVHYGKTGFARLTKGIQEDIDKSCYGSWRHMFVQTSCKVDQGQGHTVFGLWKVEMQTASDMALNEIYNDPVKGTGRLGDEMQWQEKRNGTNYGPGRIIWSTAALELLGTSMEFRACVKLCQLAKLAPRQGLNFLATGRDSWQRVFDERYVDKRIGKRLKKLYPNADHNRLHEQAEGIDRVCEAYRELVQIQYPSEEEYLGLWDAGFYND